MENINLDEFNDILDRLSDLVAGGKFLDLEKVSESIGKACGILGAARVIRIREVAGEKDVSVYFEKEDWDSIRGYFVQTEESDSAKTGFTFFPEKNSTDWDEEKRSLIVSFAKILHIYSAYSDLNCQVEKIRNHDFRFPEIYGSSYLCKYVDGLVAENKIGGYAAAFFNLRNFSSVNVALGNEKATEVLGKFFLQIKNTLGTENGIVAALNGDTGIAVYKKECHIEVLNCLISTDIHYTGDAGTDEKITLSANVGINLDMMECKGYHDVFNTLSVALETSRREHSSKFVIYDNRLAEKTEMNYLIETWFNDALKSEEFLVYYQPKVDLHDYTLKGAEALSRWIHDGKMIYPDVFIPVIEKNFMVKYLDIYMLRHVCEDISRWLTEGKQVPQISVNLSRSSLVLHNIVDLICSTIDNYGIPHSLIQIELTESSSAQAAGSLKALVEGLAEHGISTAVDDFGTGFSSLSLIRELPWSVLKIDKSLLAGIENEGCRNYRLFKSIVSMANELGLECIVEGVESRADVRLVKESGCYLAQGYYFDRPLPVKDFEEKLASSEPESVI